MHILLHRLTLILLSLNTTVCPFVHLMFSFFPKIWNPVSAVYFVLNPRNHLEGNNCTQSRQPPSELATNLVLNYLT
jgi:hypothetical protein